MNFIFQHNHFRFVGGEEIIGSTDCISIDSPMAQALLKKVMGDEVVVKTPAHQFTWRITHIAYQKQDGGAVKKEKLK